MTAKESEKNQWREPIDNSWGVSSCPLCGGIGLISHDEWRESLRALHESLCPICESYRNESACGAWMKLDCVKGREIWLFILENACDEFRAISNALGSLASNSRIAKEKTD